MQLEHLDDGVAGPWRRPTNNSADEAGSIHDDDTAQALGFEGGTVAGSIHMEQFPPLLEAVFGERFWRDGTLSLYFRNATRDGEPVRCRMAPPETGADGIIRARVWMEREDGLLVNEGTASVGGHDDESALRRRVREVRPAADLRMFADAHEGATCEGVPTRIEQAAIDRRLPIVTEPLAEFTDPSRFGGTIPPLAELIHVMRVVEPHIVPVKGPFVGLFGAIEIEFIDGPALAGVDYLARGELLALSESPKTEISWYEVTLTDAAGHDRVRMLKMDRLMKAASPLWADAGQER